MTNRHAKHALQVCMFGIMIGKNVNIVQQGGTPNMAGISAFGARSERRQMRIIRLASNAQRGSTEKKLVQVLIRRYSALHVLLIRTAREVLVIALSVKMDTLRICTELNATHALLARLKTPPRMHVRCARKSGRVMEALHLAQLAPRDGSR